MRRFITALHSLKKFKSASRRIFLITVIAVLLITSTLSYLLYVNSRSTMLANAQTNPQSIELTGCHNKVKINELYDIPSKVELRKIISTTKLQKIYKDYSKFLESKGYVEYTDSAFCGYFKRPPVIKRSVENSNKDLKFSYIANLGLKKLYILIVPFAIPSNTSKVAGIIFVYSNKHVLSYIIEESKEDSKSSKGVSVRLFLENSKGEITNIKSTLNADSFIDWQCLSRCLATSAWKCVPFVENPPLYFLCTSALWAMCHDFCTLSKP